MAGTFFRVDRAPQAISNVCSQRARSELRIYSDRSYAEESVFLKIEVILYIPKF